MESSFKHSTLSTLGKINERFKSRLRVDEIETPKGNLLLLVNGTVFLCSRENWFQMFEEIDILRTGIEISLTNNTKV